MFTLEGELPFDLSAEDEWHLALLQSLVNGINDTSVKERHKELEDLVANLVKDIKAKPILEIAASSTPVDLKSTFTNLALAVIKQLPSELMIKLIIKDPSLLTIADHEALKGYWRKYIHDQLFVITQDGSPTIYENYKEGDPILVDAKRSYRMAVREDLSIAEQGVALKCFIEDKNHREEYSWQRRHQWRMLAVKYGSIHAAYRAIKFFIGYFDELNPSIPSDEGILLVNRSLNLCTDMVAIHGATGFYLLAFFCIYLAKILSQYSTCGQKKAMDYYKSAYQAMLLVPKIQLHHFSMTSLQNLTFGNPDGLIEMYFKYNDHEKLTKDTVQALGKKNIGEITANTEKLSEFLLCFFTNPQKKDRDFMQLRETLKTPNLQRI